MRTRKNVTDTTKFCPHCKQNKLHSEFSKHRSRYLQLDDYCKMCKPSVSSRSLPNGMGRRKFTRYKAIDKLGGRCSNPDCKWIGDDGERGCTDKRCLQIDHIYGGGKKEIESFSSGYAYYLNVINDETGKYQVLCANCNWIKRSENKEELQLFCSPIKGQGE
jgi:hypothetical protein